MNLVYLGQIPQFMSAFFTVRPYVMRGHPRTRLLGTLAVNLSGEAVNRHAYYVAYPSKQPSLVVPPKLPDANLAQEGVHGDSSSPGVAKIDAAHGSDAVMVEPLQFHELAFS